MHKTLEDILMDIQVNVDTTSEDIEWGDEDTTSRTSLVNAAIRRWGQDNVTRWDELFSTEELGVIDENSTNFALPSTYRLLEAVLDEDGNSIPIKKSSQSGKSGRYFYVTGNMKTGYKLNLGWKPKSDDQLLGQKISVKIYNAPTELRDPEDVPQMRNPDFIVFWVSAQVIMDDDMNKFSIFSSHAGNALTNMRDANSQNAQCENENIADDDDFRFGV